MIEIKDINLKYNPFSDITASMENKHVIWAGMEDIKSKIEKTYKDCEKNSSKQIILNWGPYGGGKTFSAYYFIKNPPAKDITHLYVRAPKDGNSATDEFFKSIIDYLSFDAIHKHIKALVKAHGEKILMDFLSPKSGHEYAKAITLIGSDDENTVQLMNRFLYVGLTKTELKNIGLAKDIQTDTDSIKFIAGLLSCFIGDGKIFSGKVVLWVDELEDLIYYSPKNYKAFSQVLRDLFDSISSDFLAFLNFTLAEGEETTIELILGGAVWSRITKKIRYKQFTVDDALKYCNDLISNAKIVKTGEKPFPQVVVQSVINFIPQGNLTPREINKHFNSLINYAIDKDSEGISTKTVSDWSIDYQEHN